jgi:cytochrome c oxidase subunit 2
MIDYFVERASTYAGDIDQQILLITILVGFWFFLAEGVFFWLIFRFRAKEGQKSQYITGEEKHQKRWINIPHFLVLICDVVIVIGAVHAWMKVKQNLPPADVTVRIVAQQWAWTFVHPGPDGVLDTDDDVTTIDELHVELGKVHHFELTAKDVLHSFSVPAFRLKQDAVPGREITGWFEPSRAGEYDIQCAEICGIGHGIMAARIYVETPEAHAAWLVEHARPEAHASALP